MRSHGTEAAYYGHASVGCLHVRPLVSLKDADGIATMVAISDEISDLVREFGGSLSGEHGDGIVRGVWTEKMFGPQIYQMFREVKAAFDPQGIMNPGKIIDCPPMTENLRYRRRLPGQVSPDQVGLFPGHQLCRRRGNVQRDGRLPQARRLHVPFLHGHQG